MKKDLKYLTESEYKEFQDLQAYFANNRKNAIRLARYTALATLVDLEDHETIEDMKTSAYTALRYFKN
jgi:hypothetical protein